MKIITITLSPAFDIHCYTDFFYSERENLAQIRSCDIGGKGINISRALDQYGIDNFAIIAVGDENGDAFKAQLEKTNITHRCVPVNGRIRENVTIHSKAIKETRLSFEGFNADDSLMDRVHEIVFNTVQDEDIVTLTGSIPSGISISKVKNFIKQLNLKNIKVVLDSRSLSLDDLFECTPFLIKPNDEETARYIKRPIKDIKDAAEIAYSFHLAGIRNVLLSLGDAGALLACDDGVFYAKAPKISAISTIGAGDSSIAGFLTAYEKQKPAVECLTTAVAYGSAACLTYGTQPPNKKDIERFIDAITTKKII